MKTEVKRKATLSLVTTVVVAAILGLLAFGASHLIYIKNYISPISHPVFGLVTTGFWLWVTSTIWLSIANLLILLVASPFMIWPSIRPAAIRAWIIGVLAVLGARFLLFYAGSM
jgi:hypothetical protein